MLFSSLYEPGVIYKDKLTIFCDNSWCKNLKIGSFAAVAMKEDCCIFMCKVGWMDNCSSPGKAEMRRILAGVEIVKQLSVNETEFVSNRVDVVWFFGSGLGGEGRILLCRMRASTPLPKIQGDL